MPDFDNSDPGAPQGASAALAVVRAAQAKIEADRAKRAEQNRADNEHRRQVRRRLKDDAAGLTPEIKAERKKRQEADASKRYRANRASKRLAAKAALPVRPAQPPMTKMELALALAPLNRWLSQPGRAQRMIAHTGSRKRYFLAGAVLLRLRRELGIDPAPAAFAAALANQAKIEISRIDAAHLLRQLLKIERATGRWSETMTASDETMTASDETMTASDETIIHGISGDATGRRYA